MSLRIQHRNFQVSQSLRDLIDKKSRKIARMLPTFAPHDLDLHVTLEKLPRGKQYRAAIVLTLPQYSFRVEDIETNPSQGVVRAFDELLQRIKKFKSHLNREKFWQRPVAPAPPEAGAGNAREIAIAISQSLDKVENYIRRELYRQALVENLPPGLLQPQAILDEVFLEVSAHAARLPDNWTIERWMIQVARDKIRNRVQELDANRDQLHVEDAAENPERWHDEALNFYQPDETLRVEDILPDDKSATPEELLFQHEREEQLLKAIAHLPDPIRESFVLFALEGFNSDEIAMITRKAPDRVLEEVQEAQGLLRQQVQFK